MDSRPSALLRPLTVRLLFSFGCGLLGIVVTLVGYLFAGLLTISKTVDQLGHTMHNPLPHFWQLAPVLLPCGFIFGALLGWKLFARFTRTDAE